jgi:hypothetical protein
MLYIDHLPAETIEQIDDRLNRSTLGIQSNPRSTLSILSPSLNPASLSLMHGGVVRPAESSSKKPIVKRLPIGTFSARNP